MFAADVERRRTQLDRDVDERRNGLAIQKHGVAVADIVGHLVPRRPEHQVRDSAVDFALRTS